MALLSVDRLRQYLSDQFSNFASRISAIFSRKDEAAYSLSLNMDPKTFVLTITLNNGFGTAIDSKNVDLPLETFLVGATYDNATKKLKLSLKSGDPIEVDISDMISGLLKDTVTIAGLNVKDNPTVDQVKSALKLHTVATSGSYNDLSDKPTIDKVPTLAKVATSGKYSDLTGTPTSLPANGGNANTVGGDFTLHRFNSLSDFVTAFGGSAYPKVAPSVALQFSNAISSGDFWCEIIGGSQSGALTSATDLKGFLLKHSQNPCDSYIFKVYDGTNPTMVAAKIITLYGGQNGGQGDGAFIQAAPLDMGSITTKIVPNSSGATITQSGGNLHGQYVTTISKTSNTVTTITQQCKTSDGKTLIRSKIATITKAADGSYTISDPTMMIGAWEQAAFIVSELK